MPSPSVVLAQATPAVAVTLGTASTVLVNSGAGVVIDGVFIPASPRAPVVTGATPTPSVLVLSTGPQVSIAGETINVRSFRDADAVASKVPGSFGLDLLQTATQSEAQTLLDMASAGVSSVGLSAPAIFSVSGSPVTTSGTLTLSLAAQTANLIWAGPASGADAAPTFRALVAADFPAVPFGNLTGVPTTVAGYGITDAVPTGAATASGLTTSTQTLLGRSSLGTGAIEELTLGSGLSLTSGVLDTTGSGSGSVTSVDLTMPAVFSVSGNPITTSGTLAVSLATQVKNLVWAGPATGADAAPTFRALVADDIPGLSWSKITSGTPTTLAGYGITDAASSGAIGSSGLTMATNKLLGRSTAGTGAPEEITIGSGLSLSSGTLSASGTGGTVTSVGLSAPAIFSVSGSPVTTSGTLAMSLATQAKNLVWAGPATGANAAPTFRSLVADDIPALDAAKITSGTLGAARLPANVAYLDAVQTFTAAQTFQMSVGTATGFNWTRTAGGGSMSLAVFSTASGGQLDVQTSDDSAANPNWIIKAKNTSQNILLSFGSSQNYTFAPERITVNPNTWASVQAPPVNTIAHFHGKDSTLHRVVFDTFGASGFRLMFRRANGTAQTPTAQLWDERIGSISVVGYDGSSYGPEYDLIGWHATEDWSTGKTGRDMRFRCVTTGTDTNTNVMRIVDGAVVVTSDNSKRPVGGERLRVYAGTIATATASDVLIGGGSIDMGTSLRYRGTQLIGAQKTGWGAPTGTATRTAFATGTVTTTQLAERLKALIDDLTSHGLIGT